jgi:hypothetical protein
MAEPLTSSDLWRKERGWGASEFATTEDRKRLAAAGELPVSSRDFEKLVEGRGISPTASKAEKEAWVASEVMLGLRDPMDLPKTYGGLGERPSATTRRGLRMQQEWDARYSAMIEEQKMAQQMEYQQGVESRLQRDQDLKFLEAKTREEREKRVQDEAGVMIDAMRGAVAPDGTIIANPIRPEDDDAIDRLNNLAGSFKYGIENKAAASMFNMLLNDAAKFREARIKKGEQDELAATNLSARTGKPIEEFGEYDEQGLFKPNLSAMIEATEALKEEEEKKAEEKAVSTETRRAEASAEVAERRDRIAREKDLDRDIRRERQTFIDLQNQKESRTRDQAIEASKNKILDLRIEKAELQGLVFDSEEEAEKAGVPSGSIIYIGRKPHKVP